LSGIWGNSLKLSIFGESHGPAIGITLDGLPPGFEIDWEAVAREMSRRAPGRDGISTPRAETDAWEILSGIFENRTAGSPLCAIIRNEGQRPGDYSRRLLRPGHADWTAIAKYGGYADYRGGGHFSGRLTAPLVFAGAIARQILAAGGVSIYARIASIHGARDEPATAPARAEPARDAATPWPVAAPWPDEAAFAAAAKKPLPALSDEAAAKMRAAILAARDEGDSVGGVVECAAFGLPRGWGDPFFDSLESRISSMMFSIPAVKGIEFGEGFGFAAMKGSEANDAYRVGGGEKSAGAGGAGDAGRKDGDGTGQGAGGAGESAAEVVALSNHNGGVNGGISNGSPLIFRVAIKPTPTIRKEQQTVDLAAGSNVTASFGGRHDPCVVPRALPAVEAGLALCLLDSKLSCVHAIHTKSIKGRLQ
jgi:chorismate synthase